MKLILPLLYSICFIGCNDSSPTTPPPITSKNEVNTQIKGSPAPVEINNEDVVRPKPKVPTAEKAVEVTPKLDVKPKPVSPSKPKETSTLPKTQEVAAVDGALLFKKCVTCHGNNGEKQALGKSQVIAGWSEPKVTEALKGYQAGTYGKEMKAVMQGQVKSLKPDEITALAKHISKLQ